MNSHWDGASLKDRAWYALGYGYGLAIVACILLYLGFVEIRHWVRFAGNSLHGAPVAGTMDWGRSP